MKLNRKWELEERLCDIGEEIGRFSIAQKEIIRECDRIRTAYHIALSREERHPRLRILSRELGQIIKEMEEEKPMKILSKVKKWCLK